MKRLNADVLFGSEHLSHDSAGKSIRGSMLVITSQGIQFIIRMAGTVILARLLTPGDYGIFGMVAVVINFVVMFKDAGLSTALTGRTAAVDRLLGSLVVDDSKIRKELGWKPPFTMAEGLKETAKWYKGCDSSIADITVKMA